MTTENPVHMLTHEHQYILKVVNSLKAFGEQIERGGPVDVDTYRGIVEFMREFADKCHHGKEEALLFPAMEEKGVPESGCPLEALRSEHVKGRQLVAALDEAINAYTPGEASAIAKILTATRGIYQLYPNHIWKEDEMVFPMVERLFNSDELRKLKTDFEQVETEAGHEHDRYVEFANRVEDLASRSQLA